MLLTIAELAWVTGIPSRTLYRRVVVYGWPMDRATHQTVRRYRIKSSRVLRTRSRTDQAGDQDRPG